MKWLKSKDKPEIRVSLKQQQSEKLAELGAHLLAYRQERSLSLEDIVILTKIPYKLLEAIEQGKLDQLPEPVYIRALIRQFAEALGLNGVECAKSFPLGSPTMELPTTPKVYFNSLLRPVHLYLLYIFVIVCSVTSLSQLLNNTTLSNSSQKPTRETVLKTQPTQGNSQVSNHLQSVSDSFNRNNNNKSLHIGVTLKASSWIRIIADGKTEFEGVLPKGTHRSWKAQEQLTVKTNNAGSVLISVNEEEAKQMGEPGKEREIKIANRPKS
jgi:cytoskeletal protein RodZ